MVGYFGCCLDLLFNLLLCFEVSAFDAFGASFVEMICLNDDGSIVFAVDSDLRFVGFVAGSLAVFRGAGSLG
jgi:hypothetical protein